jgi:hypothetical protein
MYVALAKIKHNGGVCFDVFWLGSAEMDHYKYFMFMRGEYQ